VNVIHVLLIFEGYAYIINIWKRVVSGLQAGWRQNHILYTWQDLTHVHLFNKLIKVDLLNCFYY
jgi:hypothetical protein